MATNRVKSGTNQKKLEDYRAYQEEMLKISREYSQSRLAVWVDEARSLHDTWSGFTQEWQANLEQTTALAGSKFEEMAARGEASAGFLAQSWQQNLATVSEAVEQWGSLCQVRDEHRLQVISEKSGERLDEVLRRLDDIG